MHLSALARTRTLATLLAGATLIAAGCSSDSSTPTAPGTGELEVTVTGLPSGAAASVLVTGPSGYTHAVSHSATLPNLAPGNYQLTASTVASGDTNYLPSPESAVIPIAASPTPISTTVAYSKTTTTLDLSIAGMYLTQSTQTMSGSVPLVQNRDGFLRVFVVANNSNSVAPQVRVRFYVNGTQQGSPTIISAPSHSVPTSVSEGTLSSSWNVPVPGSMIRAGLSILADVDPSHAIPEIQRTNNSFPVSGTPLALTVKDLSTFYIRLVPVKQSVNGLTGNISSGNKDAFLSKTIQIHPISAYSADVHAVYTTNALALTGGNSNGAWESILGEMQALRVAEGSPRTYYGVVKTSYTSGIAGISYIGAGASVGYDGSMEVEIASHELGHSFGRLHAPCGVNGTTDPNYPYPAGNIGAYGFDVATSTLYPPSTAEVMSYCHPQWISDYTYTGVYNFRVAHPSSPDFVRAELQPCVVVWGHITNGAVVLEPSFEILTHPSLPERGGAYALRAIDDAGAPLFSLSFDGDSIADAPGAGRAFAYAVPVASMRKPIASLVLAGPRGSSRRDAPAISARADLSAQGLGDTTSTRARVAAGGVSLAWNAQRYPLVVVRDAHTGEILSFARGGAALVDTRARDLELTLSDGVRSTVVKAHAAP